MAFIVCHAPIQITSFICYNSKTVKIHIDFKMRPYKIIFHIKTTSLIRELLGSLRVDFIEEFFCIH